MVDLSVIDTDWGNAISDRTLQSYASVADRDALWPQPRPGSMCYTELDDEYWVTRAGKWTRLPTGYVGGMRGPAQDIYGASGQWTDLFRFDWPVKLGHNYLVTAYCNVQQQVAQATSGVQISDDQGTSMWLCYNNGLPPNWSLVGTSTYYYNPSSTKNAWVKMMFSSAQAPGYLHTGPNWCYIQVADIG